MLGNLIRAALPDRAKAAWLLSQVDVAHFLEGRIRVICQALKHDDGVYSKVMEGLGDISAISSFKVNRDTGSILICYSPERIERSSVLDYLVRGARERYARGRA
ncbi:MAG: hypothetical protein K6A65_07020 [Succinivibrionaceae bacterium]|nr:hypothetical protein [Succinivibrionaceae bacterium]